MVEFEDSVFSGKSKLETVKIPSNSKLKYIGNYTFSNTALSSFTLPSGVVSIGNHCFNNTELATFVFGEGSDIKIGDNVFSGCTELKTLVIKRNIQPLNQETDPKDLFADLNLDCVCCSEEDYGIFVVSKYLLGDETPFDDDSKVYQGSKAQEWCSDFLSTEFNQAETNAILSTTKSDDK